MGCLGQYFPKGTDVGVHAAADLEFVAAQLNSRPRKTCIPSSLPLCVWVVVNRGPLTR